MLLSQIETPALIVDLDILEANLKRVADYAAKHGLRLRPHTKTHKSPLVARWQLKLGAAGMTVAKVGEAEALIASMRDSLPIDLLVAFPVIGETKLRRLLSLARQTQVTVALDSSTAIDQLSATFQTAGVDVGVLVEVDVGLGRVGVSPSEAVELARRITDQRCLRFRGVSFYPGHLRSAQDDAGIAHLRNCVEDIRRRFADASLPLEIVSGGSTPTLYRSHETGVNEIRPGTYVYNDLNTVLSGACTLEECAAAVLVTVVSAPRPGHAFVDGGSKTFSSDRAADGSHTLGRVIEDPGICFHKMNEEHGFLSTANASCELSVGDRLRIIPNHICVAVNLHEHVYGVRKGRVENVWRVEARGKLQ